MIYYRFLLIYGHFEERKIKKEKFQLNFFLSQTQLEFEFRI